MFWVRITCFSLNILFPFINLNGFCTSLNNFVYWIHVYLWLLWLFIFRNGICLCFIPHCSKRLLSFLIVVKSELTRFNTSFSWFYVLFNSIIFSCFLFFNLDVICIVFFVNVNFYSIFALTRKHHLASFQFFL